MAAANQVSPADKTGTASVVNPVSAAPGAVQIDPAMVARARGILTDLIDTPADKLNQSQLKALEMIGADGAKEHFISGAPPLVAGLTLQQSQGVETIKEMLALKPGTMNAERKAEVTNLTRDLLQDVGSIFANQIKNQMLSPPAEPEQHEKPKTPGPANHIADARQGSDDQTIKSTTSAAGGALMSQAGLSGMFNGQSGIMHIISDLLKELTGGKLDLEKMLAGTATQGQGAAASAPGVQATASAIPATSATTTSPATQADLQPILDASGKLHLDQEITVTATLPPELKTETPTLTATLDSAPMMGLPTLAQWTATPGGGVNYDASNAGPKGLTTSDKLSQTGVYASAFNDVQQTQSATAQRVADPTATPVPAVYQPPAVTAPANAFA